MSYKQLTVEEAGQALAVEHMKVDQLTRLQHKTMGDLEVAREIIRHVAVRNKELIMQLHELQSSCVSATTSDTFDRIGSVLRQHENWAENFLNELSASLNFERGDLKEPLISNSPLVFLKPWG